MSKSVKVRTKYTFCGADFSQQEPRLTTHMSKDPNMAEAYKNGKDLYATMGQGVWGNGYFDNMEHFEDGSPNVEGKARRNKCKRLLLGITYGMGPALTAENMGVSKKEAEDIINRFYSAFPKVKSWIDENELSAKENGYVEDAWGRRRRLPDAQLPEYEFNRVKFKTDFNPIVDSCGTVYQDDKKIIEEYKKKLYNCKFNKEKTQIKAEAEANGIHIHDNGGFISRAQRQATNSRIQGSASTMTKKAMIDIYNDKEINDLGFRLLISVHDELIGECPEENAEACGKRLSYLMTHAALDEVKDVPFKCDSEIESSWYLNTYSHAVQKEYSDYIKSGLSKEIAFNKLCSIHEECTEEQLEEILANEN